MNGSHVIDVLNRLLAIEYRSLPMYLKDAPPWTHAGDERASRTLEQMIADQETMAERIADLVLERGGQPDPGLPRIEFTDLNFLSLEFLLGELTQLLRQDIAAIENCVAELAGDPVAQSLAQEVLGTERGHLENLEELIRQPA